MSLAPRLVAADKRGEDAEQTLRPQTLDDFVGQAAARANLKVFVEAAKGRIFVDDACEKGARFVVDLPRSVSSP